MSCKSEKVIIIEYYFLTVESANLFSIATELNIYSPLSSQCLIYVFISHTLIL